MSDITDLVSSWYLGSPSQRVALEAALDERYAGGRLFTDADDSDQIMLLSFSLHADRVWAERVIEQGLRDVNPEVSRHALNISAGWVSAHRRISEALDEALSGFATRFPAQESTVTSIRALASQQ